MPPRKSFLIFHNQLQKTASPNQKTLMKIAAIVIFGRKVSHGSSFKKIFSLTQNFLLPYNVVVVPLNKLFSLIRSLSY